MNASLINLPYGTMSDDEMRSMPIPMLQDEGLLFLWVTGRAMQVGRERLRVCGYRRRSRLGVKPNPIRLSLPLCHIFRDRREIYVYILSFGSFNESSEQAAPATGSARRRQNYRQLLR